VEVSLLDVRLVLEVLCVGVRWMEVDCELYGVLVFMDGCLYGEQFV